MTVVYQTKSYAASTPYMPSAGASVDVAPGAFVNAQTTAWVNAINDPAKINIVKDMTQATSYVAGQAVRMVLNTPERVGAASGFMWQQRDVGTAALSGSVSYHTFVNGTGSNGYGTWSGVGGSKIIAPTFSTSLQVFIAYEADVALPWIAVVYQSALFDQYAAILSRLDQSAIANPIYGNYTKSGLWLHSVFSSSGPNGTNQAILNATVPVEGIVSGNPDNGANTGWVVPTSTSVASFPAMMIGGMGYCGTVNPDCAFLTGSTVDPWTTETMTVLGKTYRRGTRNLWVRIA